MNSPTLLTGRLWQLNLESVKMQHHGFKKKRWSVASLEKKREEYIILEKY